ncbi:hypothetical protein NPS01_33160 [Nocardioides psychrotolerans]|nr:hypothetical protein NPS01_33160 [Nocardioides psychrotolerans]
MRSAGPSTTPARPSAVRSTVDDVVGVDHVDNPAEVRVLLHSLGLPVAMSPGLAAWKPATASAIDGPVGRDLQHFTDLDRTKATTVLGGHQVRGRVVRDRPLSLAALPPPPRP